MEIAYIRDPKVTDTVFTGLFKREPHHITSELNKMVCSLRDRFRSDKAFVQAMFDIGIDGATITEYTRGVRPTALGRVSQNVPVDCVIAICKHGGTRLCFLFDVPDKESTSGGRKPETYIPIRPAWETVNSYMWIRCVYEQPGTGMGCKWVELSEKECEALFDSWEASPDV